MGVAPAYGFGSSQRKSLKDDGQPGPGSYEHKTEIGDLTAQ